MKDLATYRKSYEKSELIESALPENPLELFDKWFLEVEQFGGVEEVNAMSIASIGLDGFPKARIVLLKQITNEGFIFYTNYNSEKGRALAVNPNVSISFFWPNLERQVIIKGVAEKTSETVSTNYFNSRPAGSQLGAIVSPQSDVILNRSFLENKLVNLVLEFKDKAIPRPEHWGGYLVKPISIEFWQGRANRLHDRIRYIQNDNQSWKIERLAP
jgi:pyridoxamine 5'-phosphate oxidase